MKFGLQTFSEQNLRYLIVFKIPALNFLNNFVVVTESQLLLYYADILVIDHFYAMFVEKVLWPMQCLKNIQNYTLERKNHLLVHLVMQNMQILQIWKSTDFVTPVKNLSCVNVRKHFVPKGYYKNMKGVIFKQNRFHAWIAIKHLLLPVAFVHISNAMILVNWRPCQVK